ncbi:fatty acid hydroxylase superfamily-domain-containing protein [Phakopsora pachyrhizi]|uniref:Fatty acid hydroxylase superfamily-domain-containing protein n=1 Tax=Phakopsora pachyrhizi TaxID=170000 RepID=A0AAV0AMT5_PHAPC|nr:fatty acid hydroxylase superfamily-domain-containing protein [Phakopsora pachyrhizi]KAI8452663.1 fatty acid hydroxylase superfamily-domain-containing protein [Phakopsora pachyrhizi]CAH7669296.1 fatty acid hydroxylase superfamily-domain-containing protein [Phakopsora pachyrhizi]
MTNYFLQSNNTQSDPLITLIYPSNVKFPIYHFHRDSIIPQLSDPALALISPLFAYWAVSGFFTLLDHLQLPSVERYRIHEPEEVRKRNRVTPSEVIRAVVFQQFAQTVLGILYLDQSPPGWIVNRDYLSEMRSYAGVVSHLIRIILPPKHAFWVLTRYGESITQFSYWWAVPILQFLWATFVMDTWQYFWHRGFHTNQFLYRHIHSIHHRLYCPYSYGALYNHPIEGFILDSLGAIVAHLASGMSIRQAILLFGISTAKTVDDHCGLALPWDPLQHLFGNNAAYHDIHHQQFGIKANFSQPYFIHWDVWMGTRMTEKEARLRRKKSDINTDSRDILNNNGNQDGLKQD